eukprot:GEMP01005055.1.p1 GENE.GEMP01005055.1~~GEMP01005055.1.p1  ORF type:complete len:546 (+),score=102.10 GEMP01005055.1:74-1711(+)
MFAVFVWAVVATLCSAKRFCGKPEYKALSQHAVDTKELAEASALVMSSDLKWFYLFSDSPKNDAFIFVHSASTGLFLGKIDIVGIANPHYNGGYGDWEAGVVRSCESDPSKMCILVGDIGHNCVRMDGGMFRMPNQPTRIIEVPEPSANQLSKDRPLQITGIEYHFQYPNEWLFDAEALVVDNENRLLIITKNTVRKYQYAHIFKFPTLSRNSVVTLEHRAIIKVEFSEVTDATNTGEYLALRTYCGINFYAWDRLHEPNLRAGTGYFSMQWLRDKGELHEGFFFDHSTNIFYFVAEGGSKITYLTCPDANPTGATPPLTRNFAALDDFGRQADPMLFQKGLKDKKCYKKAQDHAEPPDTGAKGKKGRRSSMKSKGNPKEGQHTSRDERTSRPNRYLEAASSSRSDHGEQTDKRKSERRPDSRNQAGTDNRYIAAGRSGSKKQSLLCIGDDYGQWSGRDSDDREHWRGRGEEGYDSNRRWQEDENPVLKRKVTRRRRKNKFAWSKTRLRSRERKKGNILWQKRQKEEMHGGIGLPLRKTAFFHFC